MLFVAVALVAGGCGGSDSSTPDTAPPSSTSTPRGSATPSEAPSKPTKVDVAHVFGNARKPFHRRFAAHSKSLRKHVRVAVDGWFDDAFVGVSYPRDDFKAAFGTFTDAAKHDARGQLHLMTNWQWRKTIDGVDVTKRRISLDVLAPHGRAGGVTARFALAFTTTGNATKKVEVTGRLLLTKDSHGTWRIFGYDVSKGAK